MTPPRDAPRTAKDRSHGGPTGIGRDIALVSVFAALIVVLSVVPAVPVGPAGVPITLQTLALMITGLVLGPWRGAAAAAVYVALGLAGLPVFSGGSAGLGVLGGPTAGYLLAFVPGTLVTGVLAVWAVRRRRGRLPLLMSAALIGCAAVVSLGGWLGLMVVADLSPGAAFVGGVLPYIPGDLLKVVVAAFVAASVHRAFPDVLARRAEAVDGGAARAGQAGPA